MPCDSRRRVLATELDTAPAICPRREARASMKKLTVDPVPTPTMPPAPTSSRAASAARCLLESWIMVTAVPLKQLCPLSRAPVVKLW